MNKYLVKPSWLIQDFFFNKFNCPKWYCKCPVLLIITFNLLRCGSLAKSSAETEVCFSNHSSVFIFLKCPSSSLQELVQFFLNSLVDVISVTVLSALLAKISKSLGNFISPKPSKGSILSFTA